MPGNDSHLQRKIEGGLMTGVDVGLVGGLVEDGGSHAIGRLCVSLHQHHNAVQEDEPKIPVAR